MPNFIYFDRGMTSFGGGPSEEPHTPKQIALERIDEIDIFILNSHDFKIQKALMGAAKMLIESFPDSTEDMLHEDLIPLTYLNFADPSEVFNAFSRFAVILTEGQQNNRLESGLSDITAHILNDDPLTQENRLLLIRYFFESKTFLIQLEQINAIVKR